MTNITSSAKFLAQQHFKKHFPVFCFTYKEAGNNIDFTVYEPEIKIANPKLSGKTILAIHGMSPLGADDPRFISACKSLSGCGYIVVAPHIESIRNLQIDPSAIDQIISIINTITDNKYICPEGRLSVFAASFAGGLALIASCNENIAQKISSICLIGSFSSMEKSIYYLLSNQDSDDYGRLIILKNFLKYSINVSDEIYKALDIAISDNFLCREFPDLPGFLNTMPLKDYDIFIRLMNDPYFRQYHWDRIKKNRDFEQILDKVNSETTFNKISASILIMHGVNDKVIPALESIRLYNELRRTQVRTKLILSPLLSHSEMKINVNVIPAVADLLKGMSFFFSAI
ncbi:MAG: prolyl oligopeptidase family serine peptidase [Spirochaetota bacterium]